MPDYRAMYFGLAGKVADAVELLVAAQREAEALAMQEGCGPVVLTLDAEKGGDN